MEQKDILKLIEIKSNQFSVLPELIAAIVATESMFRVYAMRYEHQWKYLSNPEGHAVRLGTTIETETVLQSFSYGLLQVMGSIFREYGFLSALPAALHPEDNLHYGIQHFKGFLDKYGNIEDAISSYNQGSPRRGPDGDYVNQYYVDKVLTLMKKYQSTDI